MVSLRLAKREKVLGKWHVVASQISREYWDVERSPEKSDRSKHDRFDPLEAARRFDEAYPRKART